MRRLLVLFLTGIAVLGLTSCGGGGSSKSSKSTPTTTTAAAPAAGGSGSTASHGLAPYLKCLGQHGVNVKKVVAEKGTGDAGSALKKDPHFATAKPLCTHFLTA